MWHCLHNVWHLILKLVRYIFQKIQQQHNNNHTTAEKKRRNNVNNNFEQDSVRRW